MKDVVPAGTRGEVFGDPAQKSHQPLFVEKALAFGADGHGNAKSSQLWRHASTFGNIGFCAAYAS